MKVKPKGAGTCLQITSCSNDLVKTISGYVQLVEGISSTLKLGVLHNLHSLCHYSLPLENCLP